MALRELGRAFARQLEEGFVRDLREVFEKYGLDPEMSLEDFAQLFSDTPRSEITNEVAEEVVYEVGAEDEPALSLTLRQYQAARARLRLADSFEDPVTTKTVIQEICQADVEKDGCEKVLIRLLSSWSVVEPKLREALGQVGESPVFPLLPENIGAIRADENVKDILGRLSRVPAYTNKTLDEILTIIPKKMAIDLNTGEPVSVSKKKKYVVLSEEERRVPDTELSPLTEAEKWFLAVCVNRKSQQARINGNDRMLITRLVVVDQRLENEDWEAVKSSLGGKIKWFLGASREDQAGFLQNQDSDTTILLGVLKANWGHHDIDEFLE